MSCRASTLVGSIKGNTDVSRLIVSSAQPYYTRAGPALSVQFTNNSDLLSFQTLPFALDNVAPYYYTALFRSLAEYADTVYVLPNSNVTMQCAVKKDFWQSVGILNCFYATRYAPCLDNKRAADLCRPAIGAVELARPSHRKESDVRLTLYNNAYSPLSSMVITGPSSTSMLDDGAAENDACDSIDCNFDDSTSLIPSSHFSSTEQTLSCANPSLLSAQYAWKFHYRDDPATDVACRGHFNGRSVYGGLRKGDIESCVDAREGCSGTGFCQKGFLFAQPTDTLSSRVEKDMADDVVPPEVLLGVISDFFDQLRRGAKLPGIDNSNTMPAWSMYSYKAIQCNDVQLAVSFHVRCAKPQIFSRYRLPGWRHQIGLPSFSSPRMCAVLHVEVVQGNHIVTKGTYFFAA